MSSHPVACSVQYIYLRFIGVWQSDRSDAGLGNRSYRFSGSTLEFYSHTEHLSACMCEIRFRAGAFTLLHLHCWTYIITWEIDACRPMPHNSADPVLSFAKSLSEHVFLLKEITFSTWSCHFKGWSYVILYVHVKTITLLCDSCLSTILHNQSRKSL